MYKRTVTGKSEATFTYVGNLMDTASGGESFDLDWDENGQLTLNDQTTGDDTDLLWNWDNKLRQATKGSKSVSLKYDPYGNRIIKDVNDGQTIRKYIVDIVGELPVILVVLDNSQNVLNRYLYANSQIVAQHDVTDNNKLYFYLNDRLGSVRMLMDTDCAVQHSYTYNPFGEVLESGHGSPATSNCFMFTGQFFDSEIDEYYLRARQYDPYLYRFTSRDLVVRDFNEPLALHRYLYCTNDPINWTDPVGLDKYFGVDFIHPFIAVDVWAGEGENARIIGQRRYDFSAFVNEQNLFAWENLKALLAIVVGPGIVRSRTYDVEKEDYWYTFIHRKEQSREEDERLLERLEAQVENPPLYNVFFFNCWHWSLYNFYLDEPELDLITLYWGGW